MACGGAPGFERFAAPPTDVPPLPTCLAGLTKAGGASNLLPWTIGAGALVVLAGGGVAVVVEELGDVDGTLAADATGAASAAPIAAA